ncbi:NUDIX hydrolase [Gilvibacter sp.]|jgi:8-oxo-dGTP pyrophosphatase MutT (NUDIX family)|uniref:NUDIX hydrolase n=1 Tax=Gilvibacter sp. TaxID=2729997 RepID=UPI0035BE6B0B
MYYKVFINEIPVILSTEKSIGKKYVSIPIELVRFKKLIKKIEKGELTHVNLYHAEADKLEYYLRKKLKVVEAGGGLVYNDNKEILFIYRNKKWDLPKGGLEKDETPEDAAVREVQEETGAKKLEVTRFIQKTYHVFKRNGERRLKITYWYEMHTSYSGNLKPQTKEGIEKAKWKNFAQTQKALQGSYENIKLLFPKEYLTTHPVDRIA